MYKRKARIKHNIDLVFLVVLFLIFTFSAVSVLLLEINCYRTVVLSDEENGQLRIACAYVRELVHQYDEANAIVIDTVNDVKCLKINEFDDYYIYIYFWDGALCELNAKGDYCDFSAGTKVIELSEMDMSQDDGLISITFTDMNSNTETVLVGIKTKGAYL